jgi:hypothetical protein
MMTEAVLAAFIGALVPGPAGSAPGARCSGSYSALGTSNISASPADVNTPETTVVNIWLILNQKNERQGWVIKTLNGRYWYGPPIGLKAQEVDDVAASRLTSGDLHMVGCFKGDLDRKYL